MTENKLHAYQKKWRAFFRYEKKQVRIFLFAFLFLFLLIFLARGTLAKIAWKQYRSPQLSLAFNQNDAALAKAIGDFYFGGGKYDLKTAARAYEKAVAIDPKISYGHYQLARIYFVQKKYDAAIEAVNRELKINSENFRAYYVRGLVYGYRGNLDKAEADFREFIKWAPREWAGYNDLAWILMKRYKFEEAKAAAQEAFRIIPEARENPWLLNSLGVAQLNLEEYGKAEKSFLQAEKFAKDLTPAAWREAYPGNDPITAADGLSSFLEATQRNLETARQAGR